MCQCKLSPQRGDARREIDSIHLNKAVWCRGSDRINKPIVQQIVIESFGPRARAKSFGPAVARRPSERSSRRRAQRSCTRSPLEARGFDFISSRHTRGRWAGLDWGPGTRNPRGRAPPSARGHVIIQYDSQLAPPEGARSVPNRKQESRSAYSVHNLSPVSYIANAHLLTQYSPCLLVRHFVSGCELPDGLLFIGDTAVECSEMVWIIVAPQPQVGPTHAITKVGGVAARAARYRCLGRVHVQGMGRCGWRMRPTQCESDGGRVTLQAHRVVAGEKRVITS